MIPYIFYNATFYLFNYFFCIISGAQDGREFLRSV